jgi:pseudouridine-5'-phosphate glycosidase/pseudouridine kinase
VVAGSVALDLSCDYTGTQSGAAGNIADSPLLHTSNPASISQSVGGVGHNVALAAHRSGGGNVKVKLCSVVGDDV